MNFIFNFALIVNQPVYKTGFDSERDKKRDKKKVLDQKSL